MTVEEIINKLKAYDVVACDMYHEKVKVDEQTGLPVFKNNEDGLSFERVSLCPAHIRKSRLGCAHSAANHNFLNLFKNLNIQDKTLSDIVQNIDDLLIKVYAIDHQKGELEKELAESLLPTASIEPGKIESKIKVSIDSHRTLIAELKMQQKLLIERLTELEIRSMTT